MTRTPEIPQPNLSSDRPPARRFLLRRIYNSRWGWRVTTTAYGILTGEFALNATRSFGENHQIEGAWWIVGAASSAFLTGERIVTWVRRRTRRS